MELEFHEEVIQLMDVIKEVYNLRWSYREINKNMNYNRETEYG